MLDWCSRFGPYRPAKGFGKRTLTGAGVWCIISGADVECPNGYRLGLLSGSAARHMGVYIWICVWTWIVSDMHKGCGHLHLYIIDVYTHVSCVWSNVSEYLGVSYYGLVYIE